MDLKELTKKMDAFVNAKGWYEADSLRPQTPANLAVSLAIEAAEVLELFQWGDQDPSPDALGEELADVTLFLLQIASVSGVDLEQAVLEKLAVNYTRQWD